MHRNLLAAGLLLLLAACQPVAKKDHRLSGTWKVVDVDGFRLPGDAIAEEWKGKEKEMLDLFRSFEYRFGADSSFTRSYPGCSGKDVCISGKFRKDKKIAGDFVCYGFCDSTRSVQPCPDIWLSRFGHSQYEVSTLLPEYGIVRSRITKRVER